MSNRPHFSVVLPTLGKSEYLGLAIRSVLNQSFGDFELIVSNNSPFDHTFEVVRQFSDNRIRYFKTNRTLPIDESYNFAVDQSRGEYVVFLGDDDAYSVIYLERLTDVIHDHGARLIATKMCDYYFDDITLHGTEIKGNTLGLSSFDNELEIYSSRKVINYLFWSAGLNREQGVKPHGGPQLLNAAYHHSIVSELKSRLGYFLPKVVAVDIFSVITTMSLVDEYYYLNSPLSIHGFSKTSLTSIASVEKLKEFVRENREHLEHQHVPLSFYTPANQVADVILRAKSAMGDDLSDIEITWDGYYRKCLIDLQGLIMEGCDMSAEMSEFWDVVESYDSGLKKDLWKDTYSIKRQGYVFLNNTARRLRLYNLLKRLTRDSPQRLIPGKSLGFSDINECASAINKEFLSNFAVT